MFLAYNFRLFWPMSIIFWWRMPLIVFCLSQYGTSESQFTMHESLGLKNVSKLCPERREKDCHWPYLGLTEAPFSTMSESGSDPMRVSPSCWRENEETLVSSAALWRIFRRTNPIHYRRNIFKRNFSQWRNILPRQKAVSWKHML